MKVLLVCAGSLILAGCGGGGSSISSGGGGGGGGGNTTGQAQGVYSGTSSNGYSFDTIVLPNDKIYAIYGTTSGNALLLFGLISGQGTSVSGSYTASVTDFFYTGATNNASLTASYVPGSSLNGTLTENGTNITFTGTSLPASSFNYNTPASLSAISGTCFGPVLPLVNWGEVSV